MQKKNHSNNFSRGLAIMNYILEGDGHSILEASQKFRLSKSIIKDDLNFVGHEVFYGNRENSEELKQKYIEMRKTLSRLSKDNSSSELQKAVSN